MRTGVALVTGGGRIHRIYDDNLFATPSRREWDVISRLSPGIQAGYESVPLTILGRYSFDAEVFPRHPDLTTELARQFGAAELRYLPTPLWTLSLTGNYAETHTGILVVVAAKLRPPTRHRVRRRRAHAWGTCRSSASGRG